MNLHFFLQLLSALHNADGLEGKFGPLPKTSRPDYVLGARQLWLTLPCSLALVTEDEDHDDDDFASHWQNQIKFSKDTY